jgi:hypothetical protein
LTIDKAAVEARHGERQFVGIPAQIVAILIGFAAEDGTTFHGESDLDRWAAVVADDVVRVVSWTVGVEKPADIRAQVFDRREVVIRTRWDAVRMGEYLTFDTPASQLGEMTIDLPESNGLHVKTLAMALGASDRAVALPSW